MQLIDRATNKPVAIGDTITDFRGKPATVIGFTPPHKPGSTGRVMVDDPYTEYFPSVFNLEWREV